MTKFNEQEQQVLEVKYKALPIVKLTEKQRNLEVGALILKICLITGWKTETDELDRKIIRTELENFLLENYPTINADEIMFAFRKYGTKVNNWGQNINLNLIRQALDPYIEFRKEVSDFEERINSEKQIPQLDVPILSDDDIVNNAKEMFLSTGKVSYINPKAFDILIARKSIEFSEENIKTIISRARHFIRENSENKREMQIRLKDEDYIDMICKKIAVADFFKK